ncbi:AbrB/MazE/SpoVT family DNA-binding domain-containing protein [Achromobacter kerstersii]|jgi:antitoxin MazE|uniref:AbrB/MazE/SpoVT family DNA-binding domain-containing protein n=1 Tax=Achromobacter kerstersii TaxID=1353890 RepID=UPI0032083100
MRLEKWGNSLAVRLPASVVDVLGLQEGDDIEIHVQGDRRFEVRKTAGEEGVLAKLREFRGRLSANFVFKRE